MSGEIGKLLIDFLVRKARRTPPLIDPLTAARVARYPAVNRCVGWALFGLCAAGAGLLTYKVPQHARLATALCSGALLAAVLAMVLDFTRVSLMWADNIVIFTSPWRGERTLRWEEVVEVKFSGAAGWFVVRTRTGLTIRPAMMLGGLEEFFAELVARGQPSLHSQVEAALRFRAERAR